MAYIYNETQININWIGITFKISSGNIVFNFRDRNTHHQCIFVRKERNKKSENASLISNLRDRANHSIISHEKSPIIIIFLKSRRRREKLQWNYTFPFVITDRAWQYSKNCRETKSFATRVKPDINSRVHFVGVNNFASFRFVSEEMPNTGLCCGTLRSFGLSDSS